jgi:hypothetical protein
MVSISRRAPPLAASRSLDHFSGQIIFGEREAASGS